MREESPVHARDDAGAAGGIGLRSGRRGFGLADRLLAQQACLLEARVEGGAEAACGARAGWIGSRAGASALLVLLACGPI